jgi:hypothetical protein
MNRIVVTPTCAMRFFEVCSQTPCTELPSVVAVAVSVMKLPGSSASRGPGCGTQDGEADLLCLQGCPADTDCDRSALLLRRSPSYVLAI